MREISKMRALRFPVYENKQDMMVIGDGTGKNMGHDHAKSMPNAVTYPTMDSYGHYRSLVMAASLPNETGFPPESFSQDHPFSAGYSFWDQKIIDRAAELCGFKARKLSDGYSKEADEVHKVSPVNSGAHPSKKARK